MITDPALDLDPANNFGSERIRIHNTDRTYCTVPLPYPLYLARQPLLNGYRSEFQSDRNPFSADVNNGNVVFTFLEKLVKRDCLTKIKIGILYMNQKLFSRALTDQNKILLLLKAVMWIRIRSDLKLFAGSGSVILISDPDPTSSNF